MEGLARDRARSKTTGETRSTRVARSRGWPTSRDVARLAARVVELSAAYNDPARARAAVRDAGAARLGFSFARDVPKGAAAVRELVAAGALPCRPAAARPRPRRRARGDHVGPGARARRGGLRGGDRGHLGGLRRRGARAGHGILRARRQPARARSRSRCAPGRCHAGAPLSAPVGSVRRRPGRAGPERARRGLSGRDPRAASRRAAALAARRARTERMGDGGAVVVIEPALRDRARHLHRVRDDLASGGATIFAPVPSRRAVPGARARRRTGATKTWRSICPSGSSPWRAPQG